MTDINHPVDEEQPEVVEPQVETPSVEDLTQQIERLKNNRDAVLTEKRAIKEARQSVDQELSTTKEALTSAQGKYEALLKQTTINATIAKLKPLDGCQEFFEAEINRVLVLDGDKAVFEIEGNQVDADEFQKHCENKYAQFMRGPDSSGATGYGNSYAGLASGKSKVHKTVGSDFGLGK